MNSYLDIFIGSYSIETVLAELARCLALFPNLHTVQIDVVSALGSTRRSLGIRLERAFHKYSYPQIRNIFVMFASVPFIASCPQARRLGFRQPYWIPNSFLQTTMNNCLHLEELDYPELLCSSHECQCMVFAQC